MMSRVFHENGQKIVSPDWPENTQIDRTRQALQHIKIQNGMYSEKKVMVHGKIAKKSIKLAYLRAFFANNFFSREYFCVNFF